MADADPCLEDRLKRLRFRAWRRGFREADLVLGGFLERAAPTLTPIEVGQFEALLDIDDHQLYAWIGGAEPTPPVHETPLMGRMRAFMRNDVAATIGQGVT